MTNVRALTQVRQDLAAGRRSAAVRRLRAMLASDPADLEVYRMLTEIHRKAGDLAEAGRWGYLSGDATPEETAAFERAHPQPWVRLRLLGKSLDPAKLPTKEARARLADLHRQVNEATIPIQHQRRAGRSGGGLTELPTQPIPGAGGRTVTVPSQRGSTATSRRHPAASATTSDGPRTSAPQVRSRVSELATGVIKNARRAAATITPPATAGPVGTATPTAPANTSAPGRPAGSATTARAVARTSAIPAQPTVRATSQVPAKPATGKPSSARRRLPRGGESLRNYLMLAALIVVGLLGSLASVGGVRAIFGVRNWLSPIQAIIDAISGIVN